MARTVELQPGMVFGHITLTQRVSVPGRRGAFWICNCVCGNSIRKYAGHIRAGQAKSCGCIKGAHRTHEMSHTPEYRAWDNARSRCYSERNRKFPHYGGRGIAMCDRWRNSFANFLEDMGRKPDPSLSLDRINNDGPYAPGNCRWATSSQQNKNRRPFK